MVTIVVAVNSLIITIVIIVIVITVFVIVIVAITVTRIIAVRNPVVHSHSHTSRR